jgi:hypothetical protein
MLFVAVLAFAPVASADKVISGFGEGAGQTNNPQGVAVDRETGRLYAVDTDNHRVEIFDSEGNFEKAFGWGVKDGKAEFQTCTTATTCRKGLSGAGKGQFHFPTKIAVDNDPASPSHHAVYVSDAGNLRIEKFDEEGNFILTFGGGVNKTTSADICTAASADTCGAGSDGEGEGELTSSIASGIFVGVGPAGVVYVIDSPRPASVFQYRLQKFAPSGAAIPSQKTLFEGGRANGLAVDSSGAFYVSNQESGQAIRKYNVGAELPPLLEIPGGFSALAVDSTDHLFVASAREVHRFITEYDLSGAILRRFGYGSFYRTASGLAPYHSATGDIFSSEESGEEDTGSQVQHLDFPLPGPLPLSCKADPVGNTKATLSAEVNPEGKSTTTHFQYISDADFLVNGNSFSGPKPAASTAESASIGVADFDLHKASAQTGLLVPETKYHCRVVASNAEAASVAGPEGTFTSLAPLEIGATWVSGVATEAATLNAEVNPLGIPTTAYFEYVDEATYLKDIAESGPDHGFDHASKAPAGEPIDLGAGESPKAAGAAIGGLVPGTAYRYRVVATDFLIAPKEIRGPTKAFRTFGPGKGALPDDRAWELVSPGEKNGAEVGVPGLAAGLNEEIFPRIQATTPGGDSFTYTSWTSFGAPESAPGTSQYLAGRGAGGWATENISPFGFIKNPLEPPYRGFTPDFGFSAVVTDEPPLTEDCQQGFANIYLRENASGALRCLSTEAPLIEPAENPADKIPFCFGFAGATADGKHAIFSANGSFAGAPVGREVSLYEWSAAGGLALVSVLPNGNPAQPALMTNFGAGGGRCSMSRRVVAHAISEDGSTLFWTYGGKYSGADQPLFARIGGAETIQLDAKAGGSGPAGGGQFRAAAADGSKAFFTAPGKLTADAGGAGSLYRYDTVARSLANLTPSAAAPEVKGVIGASEDGAYVYFVAAGALTAEEESDAGQKAQPGANNLYLWHEGEGLRFIARLSGFDAFDWDPVPAVVNARVTPDGRHLAFLSIEAEALSGYDNTIAEGAHCQPEKFDPILLGDPHCPEAYLYDADEDELICASCNPSGARPTGPVSVPGWSNPLQGPRWLSDDGSRLYFESRDTLSNADENERRDVYEFEEAGSGTCSEESPTFNPASGGCLFLLSSGKSSDESYLLDASQDGRDVFLATRQSLVGWDVNENYDVYDARVGGGFPEPQSTPICEGEACKPPPTSPPSSSGSATSQFQGPGNQPPSKPCKKGKVRKRGKCVTRSPRHRKPHRGRHTKSDRGGRR